jgi:hypothetical protein
LKFPGLDSFDGLLSHPVWHAFDKFYIFRKTILTDLNKQEDGASLRMSHGWVRVFGTGTTNAFREKLLRRMWASSVLPAMFAKRFGEASHHLICKRDRNIRRGGFFSVFGPGGGNRNFQPVSVCARQFTNDSGLGRKLACEPPSNFGVADEVGRGSIVLDHCSNRGVVDDLKFVAGIRLGAAKFIGQVRA